MLRVVATYNMVRARWYQASAAGRACPAEHAPPATSTRGALAATGGMDSGRTDAQWSVRAIAFGILLATVGVAVHSRAIIGKRRR